ncbi:hypothetical protein B0H14DRAFT_2280555, partial [Mycena olivaceomarginata]
WHHVLKGKFLQGKRNRHMDHLISTLVNDVLPYYALKQRRQDLGFEGINIEVRKRQDILKRSEVYVAADIEPTEDTRYLVRSKSNLSQSYLVDISTYTCTCLDFPLISFCKHIAAVQRLFNEIVHTVAFGSDTRQDDQGHLAASSDSDTVSIASNNSEDVPQPSASPAPKRGVLTILVQKLETLAARLHRPRTKASDLPTLSTFETHLEAMLTATDTGSILPTAQRVNSNVNGWRSTQQSMGVMPKAKTKARKAGDQAYRGGASSGLKVKRVKADKCVPFGFLQVRCLPSHT